MKLLDARVNGMPRQVNTKYGEKAVLDVATRHAHFFILTYLLNRRFFNLFIYVLLVSICLPLLLIQPR
jgi:hypothetical protein